ncbi:CLUMA_CG020497, isoform A [Clunio marinus]|uniref:CLUMA_CG020497, isoform A n=1 Tax=Clunio marinus TaxID=568069 RepID=A0A1J1J6X0_9DIPT|nr:CLUMA_CG020497, isoform A [Clunio marinus]
MPKNNRKSKANQASNNNNNNNFKYENDSDDEYSNDGASVYSYQSDNAAIPDVEEASDNVVEKYEEKLMQAIENASEKSQQTRTQALQVMNEIFMHHSMFDFVDERRVTILDIIEKSLKRGKGQEQAHAARMSALLLIQLQGDEDVVKSLAPLLQQTALDTSASSDARAKCCLSLALLHFLGGDDVGDLIILCQMFEGIFSGSYLKGDNTPSTANADAGGLHAAALGAWALALTLIPPGDVVSLIQTKQILASFKNLMGLLQSQHLDVRMTAGEAIALLLESGRAHDEEFLDEYITDLIEMTKLLATDSQKFRAKRDRKQQRATFRDVLHYIEEEISPEIAIQVGNGLTKEQLTLDTWAVHHQYSCICNALGSGMNIHLLDNEFLRDVFQMGIRLDPDQITTKKLSKNEKRAIQAASFKARTISRGKNRDKRSAVVN